MVKCQVHNEKIAYCFRCICASIRIEKSRQERLLREQREGIALRVTKKLVQFGLGLEARHAVAEVVRAYDGGGEEEEKP